MLDLKKEKFKGYLSQIEMNSENFYEIREDIFELKREEVRRNINKVKNDLDGEAILVFIGEFSSGKSSFINSLIDRELLPTANRPCTSTITEIQFTKDGLGNRGIIHKLDGSKTEELPFEEVLKLIDGGTSHVSNFSSIHHVDLIYDISMDVEENSLLTAYANNNIKIVDTPGFNSPYGLNESIVLEYIEKSKYSFWFFPADKIGGVFSRKMILNIKRKGIEILPVITKSDLLASEEEKEDIREDFLNELSDLFILKEPRFVSSFKIKEANELSKKLSKSNDVDLRNKIEKLHMESGMYSVAQDLSIISTNKAMKEKRLNLAIENTRPILSELLNETQKEKNYWKGTLEKKGWTEENYTSKVDKVTDNLKKWSNKEVKNLSEGFEGEVSDRVINMFRRRKGKTSMQMELGNIINQVTLDYVNPKLEEMRTHILEKYKSEADLEMCYKLDVKAPVLFNVRDITAPLLSVFESLKYQGFNSILTGGTGYLLMSMGSSFAGLSFMGKTIIGASTIGGALSVAGGGLIAVSLLPIIPIILDKNRERAKKGEVEIKSKIRSWLREIKIESGLRNAVHEYIDELDKIMRSEMEDEIYHKLKCYNKVCQIKEELAGINNEFKSVFKGEN